MEDKELVWLPKSEAIRYEEAKSDEAKIAVIDEIITKGKKDLRDGVELLSEDQAMLEGMLLRYKKMYKETLESHSEAVYKIWEDLDSALPTMKSQTEKLEKRLQPLKSEIESIFKLIEGLSKKMDSVNSYQLEKMVGLVNAIQNCDIETKRVLLAVLKDK